MDIKPTMDNVLIKVDVAEIRSPGGLFLVNDASVVKNSGEVVAIGDSEAIKVKPGDRVLFDKGLGHRFNVPVECVEGGFKYTGRESFMLLPYFEIAAVVEGD